MQVYVASNRVYRTGALAYCGWLMVVWKKRHRDMNCGGVLVAFAALIAICGCMHICNIAVLWWPAYRLLTLSVSSSALLSIANLMWLPWLTRLALNLLTPERFRQLTLELEQVIRLKDSAINDLNGTVSALRGQLNHLERMRTTGLWVAEQETALRELKTALDSSNAPEASP